MYCKKLFELSKRVLFFYTMISRHDCLLLQKDIGKDNELFSNLYSKLEHWQI